MAERNVTMEIDSLKDDLGRIRADLGGLLDAIKSVTKSSVKATRNTVENEFEKACEELQERGHQYMTSAEKGISDRPFAAVAVAFGVGLLVGKLLDR